LARREVAAMLSGVELRRDMLIEYLHRIQDRCGHLSAAHLAALAEAMRLSQAEVYEVASFYAHFDVVREGEALPAPHTVRVCDGIACEMAGAKALQTALADTLDPTNVRVVAAPCMGGCDCAPVAAVEHNQVLSATVEAVGDALKGVASIPPDMQGYAAYREAGGYALLEACRAGKHTPETIIEALGAGSLRGLGGAGFPAGRKWEFVRAEPAPRLLAVNADEGEPGTFKDRWLLEREPHRVMEGMLIAAWAVEASDIYFYIRDEYTHIRIRLEKEFRELMMTDLCDGIGIYLRRGAGAYICGEESAMLESIEGKRGLPRHKPPFPARRGLFGRPTLIHNVETLYWIRETVETGGRGLRAYSVSGRVCEPGVKFAPAEISVRKLIDEHCGGMAEGHVFKAYLPGGASGGILPASKADLPLDFGALDDQGCFVGSAAIVVLSEGDSIAAAVRNLMRFFAEESCGQCTPCRIGTEKAVALIEQPYWDGALLEELCGVMAEASICGLGKAAPNSLRCALKFFPDEVLP
jgi:formate dehydrogenase